jgi:parallel beta-helix repeat protein
MVMPTKDNNKKTTPKHRFDPKKTRAGLTASSVLALAGLTAALVVPQLSPASADAATTYSTGPAIVADSLNRSSSSGWGTAEVGGAYRYSASQYFTANGSAGVASLPRPGSGVTATLPSVSSVDTLATTTVSVASLPNAGNGVYSGLHLRSAGGSYYQSSVRVTPQGALVLSVQRINGSTADQTTLARDIPVASGVKAGARILLEFQATGTSPVTLNARAWVEGATKPAWQATLDDSDDKRLQAAGSVGVWTYISSGTAVQPVAYDDVHAFPLVKDAAPTSPTPTPTSPAPSPTPAEPAPSPAPAKPAPSPTPTEPPVTAPDAPGTVDPTGARGAPGSAAVGSTAYAVPSGAIFVAPNGSDSAAGSQNAPLLTVKQAVASAPSGSTIVLRAGSYHEYVVIPTGKTITLQSYPGEAVWLDGSRVLSQWSKSGNAWVASGWNVTFDSSPTYSRGAPDGTSAGWQFVNPDYPMAAHPDQVWINDTALKQVSSLAGVTAGTFFVDTAADKLYIGSDPAGGTVRASDTVKALTIAGTGSIVRGIGITRYSPSVPDMGAVQVAATKVTLENVEITDTATTGLSVFTTGATLQNVTIARSGMLGAHASQADGLRADSMLLVGNNTEHFNRAPVAGGFKIHKSRTVSVTNSAFVGNLGNSLWFDESVYDMRIAGNDILDGTGNGLVIELSATAKVVDNVISRNGLDGILISDSGQVDVWNNTVTSNARSLNIVQGFRRASDLSATGHDSRQALPDPTVTWITGNITVSNNVFADGDFKCILCVEDYSHERSAAQMNIQSNGNVFQRTTASLPVWAFVWSRGAGDPAVYTSLAGFTAATGQDRNSIAVDGTAALIDATTLVPLVATKEASVAQPLPAGLAGLVGQSTGIEHLGAWK